MEKHTGVHASSSLTYATLHDQGTNQKSLIALVFIISHAESMSGAEQACSSSRQ